MRSSDAITYDLLRVRERCGAQLEIRVRVKDRVAFNWLVLLDAQLPRRDVTTLPHALTLTPCTLATTQRFSLTSHIPIHPCKHSHRLSAAVCQYSPQDVIPYPSLPHASGKANNAWFIHADKLLWHPLTSYGLCLLLCQRETIVLLDVSVRPRLDQSRASR